MAQYPKKFIKQALAEYAQGKKHLPGTIVDYFLAIMNDTLVEHYLRELIKFRDNYSDELPEEDVRNLATIDAQGRFVGDNYKCRGNIIVGIAITLHCAVKDGAIDDMCVVHEIDKMRNHDFNFQYNRFTSLEEIALINHTLNTAITYLENNQK